MKKLLDIFTAVMIGALIGFAGLGVVYILGYCPS